MTGPQRKDVEKTYGGRVRVRVGGICIKDDRILLLRHEGVGPDDYLWAPPGGGAEMGEKLPENLKREFLEETGLEIAVGELLFVNEFMDNPLHAIELFFRVKVTGGYLKLGKDPEMAESQQILKEIRYFSWQQLQDIKKSRLHNMFHRINKLEEILNPQGYFNFVINSIK